MPALQLFLIEPLCERWCRVGGKTSSSAAAKRLRVRENALHLVFKLVTRLSINWRGINGPNQIALLIAGHRFVDGKLQVAPTAAEAVA